MTPLLTTSRSMTPTSRPRLAAGFGRFFPSSRLPVFPSSRLPVFPSSRLPVLLAAASLALAACGSGGDSTVATPVVPPVERDRETDCNQMPRPAGCPPDDEPDEPAAPPVLFAGLNSAARILAYAAIQKTYFGIDIPPIDLQGSKGGVDVDKLALQMTAWEDQPLNPDGLNGKSGLTTSTGDWTKVVVVKPGGGTGNIDYTFALWNTGTLGGNSIYHIGRRADADYDTYLTSTLESRGDDFKIFSIGKDDYTAANITENINIGFEESYKYNIIKDYQVLKAEVDTNKDKQKDSTLYAELWTDYPAATSGDYLVGGIWLLMPEDMSQDYRFGGFVRGEAAPVFPSSKIQPFIEGATYKGSLAGIHTSSENDTPKISRLLGKVTLDADFGTTSTYGRIEGRGYDLKLDGTPVGGEILINIDMDQEGRIGARTKRGNPKVGNINGINYEGAAATMFHGLNSDETKPAAIVGTVGGRGGGNSFVATFGAREVKDE